MPNIAFLGTGLLGSALAEAAITRGDTVTVWNRTASKTAPLAALGATVAASPADAVRGAERVHLVLPDDTVVAEVIAALRPGLGDRVIIVDHSTTQPALTAERATRLQGEGVRYLHCPVFIGPAMARKGEGIILCAGPKADFDEVQPALTAMCARLEYLGDRADLAAVYKLLGNSLILGIGGVVSDMLTIGKGAGLSADEALKLTDFFNAQNIVNGRGRSMAAGNFTPSFELVMARKDLRLMLETAGTLPLAVLPGIAARMDALIAAGHGQQDVGVIAIDAVK
jgi:3-hydroxyisobutyrate dehydrogenase-like beta-hydroxyacid dehydrogenase